jgi:hypothetical protein
VPGVGIWSIANYIYYSQIYLLTMDNTYKSQVKKKLCDATPCQYKLFEIKHDSIIYNRTENRWRDNNKIKVRTRWQVAVAYVLMRKEKNRKYIEGSVQADIHQGACKIVTQNRTQGKEI